MIGLEQMPKFSISISSPSFSEQLSIAMLPCEKFKVELKQPGSLPFAVRISDNAGEKGDVLSIAFAISRRPKSSMTCRAMNNQSSNLLQKIEMKQNFQVLTTWQPGQSTHGELIENFHGELYQVERTCR